MQNYGQLEYMCPTDSNSFLANSGYRITFATNDRAANAAFVENAFINEDGSVREFSGSELANLDKNKELVLMESEPAKILDKICYYEDSFFKERLLPSTFIPEHKVPEYGETESTKFPDDSNVSYLSLVHDSEEDKEGDED